MANQGLVQLSCLKFVVGYQPFIMNYYYLTTTNRYYAFVKITTFTITIIVIAIVFKFNVTLVFKHF